MRIQEISSAVIISVVAILTFLVLKGFNAFETSEETRKVEIQMIEHSGHEYLMFENYVNSKDYDFTVVHSPDCPCLN